MAERNKKRMETTIKLLILSMHGDISLMHFVIPGKTKPAPYLIRGNPVFENWFPAFAGTTSGFPLEFIPVKIGAGMTPCNGDEWAEGEKITIIKSTKQLP